jgi:hypothetical protein
MRLALISWIALPALAACTPPLSLAAPTSTNWRTAALEADRDRLRDWRSTFERALAKATAAGNGPRIESEGALLQLDSALGGGLPVGTYRCRTIKLGARADGDRDYVAYGPFTCRVGLSGAVKSFHMVGGVQRPNGYIYPADRLRSVFLGALSLGDERADIKYGVDPVRDMAGWVERIGDARWRILLPDPRLESVTEVIELVPAT